MFIMKNKKLLFLSLLFFSLTSYAQLDWVELEQNRQLEHELNQDDFDYNNSSTIQTNAPNVTTSAQILADLDMDGMDDDWEMSNNLDPSDPKDAFGDLDNDKILNLFEFQLDTDPNNSSSPAVTEFTPNGSIDDLEDAIDSAEGTIQVIRLAQGDYPAVGNVIFNDGYRLMIQGGWNDDFTDYNPAEYTTSFEGPNSEVMVLLWLGIDANDSATTILEGIKFSAQNYFSLYGVVQVTNNQGHANVSIHNCSFVNSQYYGLGITQRNVGTTGNILVAKTAIGNNLEGGMYTQITGGAVSDWRLINTTINNPGSDEFGTTEPLL